MKKKIGLLIVAILIGMFSYPMNTFATEYVADEGKVSINIDDSVWYVFTRENLDNNAELAEIGMNFEEMDEFMMENDIYVDAIVFYEDVDGYLEMLLSKSPMEDVEDFSRYESYELLALYGDALEENNISDYTTYEGNHMFMELEYTISGYYVKEFFTVEDGYQYTITFQTEIPFEEWEYQEMQTIMDSVKINTGAEEDGAIIVEEQEEDVLETEENELGLSQEELVNKIMNEYGDKIIILAVVIVAIVYLPLLMGIILLIYDKVSRKKKNRKTAKRIIACILIIIQSFAIIGNVMTGSFVNMFQNGIGYLVGYLIGFFSFGIIAAILLISAHKDTKKFKVEEINHILE